MREGDCRTAPFQSWLRVAPAALKRKIFPCEARPMQTIMSQKKFQNQEMEVTPGQTVTCPIWWRRF